MKKIKARSPVNEITASMVVNVASLVLLLGVPFASGRGGRGQTHDARPSTDDRPQADILRPAICRVHAGVENAVEELDPGHDCLPQRLDSQNIDETLRPERRAVKSVP